MKKFIKTILLIILLSILIPVSAVHANTAGASAKLAITRAPKVDGRAGVLRKFLTEHNSPLADHAGTFIREADKNNLDWKLVAAISGNESQFGHLIPPYSYNGWGYGVYGNNVRRFESWDEGIAVVSNALRDDYLDNWGATNVYEIGEIYAEDPMWANKVSHYISLIENFESDSSNKYLSISL